MLPTLKEGQDVLSLNWFVNPKVGDIVVIKHDGKDMVKRIQKVDDRHIFVKGDNREDSTDSRHFGPVKIDQVVGKVIFSSENHPERAKRVEGYDIVDCPQCSSPVVGIYGRKDAICKNCGFKLACCGEP